MLEDKLKEAVAQLHAAGAGASYHVINVTKEEDWARAVAGVVATHGKVDVLVQAAGITGRTGIKTHEVDPANWDAVMGVNARGIFLGCRAVLPSMVSAGYGRIVNIASIAGKEGNAGMAAYSASKGAVIALTKCIGKEYAELGEGVSVRRSGHTSSEIDGRVFAGAMEKVHVDTLHQTRAVRPTRASVGSERTRCAITNHTPTNTPTRTLTTSPAAHAREMCRYVPATMGVPVHGTPFTVTVLERLAQKGTRTARSNVGVRPASGVTVMVVVADGSSGKPVACATVVACARHVSVAGTNRLRYRVP